jgi:uncharacterized protein involved in exopolysaccharide biosynthesis
MLSRGPLGAPQTEATVDDDLDEGKTSEGGLGVQPLEVIRFVLLSAKKHWLLSVTLFLVISVPGVLIARVLPLQYATRARVLVTPEGIRARVLASGNGDAAADLHAVQDKAFRDENLRGIVNDMNLERTWSERRPPLLAFKDRLRGGLEKLTPEGRMRALMGTVQQRFSVTADAYAGVLTIDGAWSDPRTAYELVQTVLTRFLNERLNAEVQVFEEVISILEQQKKDAAKEVEKGLAQVERASWQTKPGHSAVAPAATPSKSTPTVETIRDVGVPDPADVLRLQEVRKQIRELRDPWQQRLSDLKLQLSDLSTRYGPKHPLVVNQEARIREASISPPGLDALRTEEAGLAANIDEASRTRERIVLKGRGTEGAPAAVVEDKGVRIDSSATLSTEQSKLQQAIVKYNGLVERIDRTRIELNTAATAIKYRFTVVQKPEVPAGPTKPKQPLLIALGSVVFGLLVGLLNGPIRELLSGRMLAPWQAKTLGIPLLGELPLTENEST